MPLTSFLSTQTRRRAAVASLIAGALLSLSGHSLVTASPTSGESSNLVSTSHYLVSHNHPRGWAATLGQELDWLYQRFGQELAQFGAACNREACGTGPLVWHCLADDRQQPAAPDGYDSYYTTRTHAVTLMWPVADRDRGDFPQAGNPLAVRLASSAEPAGLPAGLYLRISHEAAHQLAFDSGLQKRGVMYPIWVTEGLSTNFEATAPGAIRFLGQNPGRLNRLAAAKSGGTLLPLARLLECVETSGLSRDQREDLYAQSWSLFRFIGLHFQQELSNYLKMLARLPMGWRDQPTLITEFEAAFKPVSEIEALWQTWLDAELDPAQEQERWVVHTASVNLEKWPLPGGSQPAAVAAQ